MQKSLISNYSFRGWFFVAFIFCIFLYAKPAVCAESSYYASLKNDEANIRTGPSARYPIQWTYKRRNWPVKVTATFERWRKISDINGEIGWIHEILLSKSRYAVVKTQGVEEVFYQPTPNSTKIFIVENGVVVQLKECKNQWCKIKVEDHQGWMKSEHLWGVDKDETIN